MMDEIAEAISKPEFLEVSHTDFHNHISLINNIVSEDKLEILAEFDNSLSTEANISEIERLIDGKSGESITEKKLTSSSRNMTSNARQVNFDEIDIENCYRSSLQKKKMAEEIRFLREQISEKNFIIRSLFSLKLSNREEDNLFHKVRKNTNGKDIPESCINDEIPEYKCVNDVKDDIALHKKNNYNQNTDEGSNNLSTTSINNYKISGNNAIRTTETPNNNDVIVIYDNLAAPTRKEKFRTNTASFKLVSAETELNTRKNSSPIICELIHLLLLKPLVVNHLV